MSKEEALELLNEIKDNVDTCCAVTLEPEDVIEDLEKIEEYIKNGTD